MCGVGGGWGVEVDDVLCDGDVCVGMLMCGMVVFFDKLFYFFIFEIKEFLVFIDDVQFFQVMW